MKTLATAPILPQTAGYDLALVLSGGGARGFAHIGLLSVVEELQLPVDLVVGVSMGSIVGAGYAAGLSADNMANLARAMLLTSIFRPRPGRLNLIDPAGIRAVILDGRQKGRIPLAAAFQDTGTRFPVSKSPGRNTRP